MAAARRRKGRAVGEYRPVADLVEYAGNPRHIPEEAVAAVARSIERYGFNQPIAVDRDAVVVAGHTRLAAAKALRISHVPVVVVEGDPGEIAAYRLADNRLGELTSWDMGALAKELEALGDLDVEIPPGFGDKEVASILRSLEGKGEGEGEERKVTFTAKDKGRGAKAGPPGESEVRVADCVEAMAALADASVDAIVTDPPYGIAFMGAEWDRPGIARAQERVERDRGKYAGKFLSTGSNVGSLEEDRAFQRWTEEWAREAHRVLKPGGWLAAFGATRLYHRTASGIQDAGFEMRDALAWIYGSGMPKSRNEKGEEGQATGRGTGLKPAWEAVVLARRPLEGTVEENAAAHGTGYLNVDAARVPLEGDVVPELERTEGGMNPAKTARTGRRRGGKEKIARAVAFTDEKQAPGWRTRGRITELDDSMGRWPANVAHDGSEAVVGEFPYSESGEIAEHHNLHDGSKSIFGLGPNRTWSPDPGGSAARFFYRAKPARSEKEAGLDGWPRDEDGRLVPSHPTVKPIELMRWLVRLLAPEGGLVLDPFAGTGTTGIACVLEGRAFLGVEREADYAAQAEARLAWWRERAEAGPGRTVAEILGAG